MCVCIQMLHVLMQMVCVVIVGIYDAFKAVNHIFTSMEKERFGDETLALTLKRWKFSFIYILK